MAPLSALPTHHIEHGLLQGRVAHREHHAQQLLVSLYSVLRAEFAQLLVQTYPPSPANS
jgi:hypothetical protein